MLKVGCPSPLWIACCNFRPSCAAFLLELLTPEDVALPGPDGTTALMQLFANACKHQDLAGVQNDLEIILDMFTLEKFGLNSVLEASIYFGNVPVFQKFCKMGVTEEECAHFAKLATLSEDTDILQYILKKSPSLKSSCQQTGRNCQSKAIREMLGLPLVQNIKSQLLEVSARFPKFNEDIEPGIKMLPTNTKVVDISQDIEPLLKEPFCGLLHSYQKNPKKMPISKWKRHSCTQTHKR